MLFNCGNYIESEQGGFAAAPDAGDDLDDVPILVLNEHRQILFAVDHGGHLAFTFSIQRAGRENQCFFSFQKKV